MGKSISPAIFMGDFIWFRNVTGQVMRGLFSEHFFHTVPLPVPGIGKTCSCPRALGLTAPFSWNVLPHKAGYWLVRTQFTCPILKDFLIIILNILLLDFAWYFIWNYFMHWFTYLPLFLLLVRKQPVLFTVLFTVVNQDQSLTQNMCSANTLWKTELLQKDWRGSLIPQSASHLRPRARLSRFEIWFCCFLTL